MITCDTPNQRLNYIFSCHLLAQVQIKIGRLEGERIKPAYKDLIQNPVLNYSGAFQHNDLYVTAQIYANNQALCMPVKTSYKYIEKPPWQWDEWLTLPLKISDLPRNALLTLTAWDIESPQTGDVPVCGATVTLFDKYGEFRQGGIELRLWPNKSADGCSKTTTPGVFSDLKESELEEAFNGAYGVNHLNNNNNANTSNAVDEFPILDELDRLAKMSRYHADGHLIKQDWLDRLTFKEIQNAIKREKQSVANSKFFFMNVEFAQIKCDDTKYNVLYYEENAERIMQTVPMNDLFVINDPELELDNIIELKNRKLEHSKQMGVMDMNLRPDPESKNMLAKIVSYPVTRPLKREEQALLWKYRYFLTQNKKALTKFLQCFDLNLEFEGNMLMELMLKWQPMDVEDALELLGSKYESYPKIRSYAISRLRLASNEDLILYLLQLVQALRYENFNPSQNQNQNLPTIKSIDGSLTVSSESSSKAASMTTSEIKNKRSKKNKLQISASSGSLRQLEQLGVNVDDQNEGKNNDDNDEGEDSGDENDDDDDDSNDNTDQTAKLNVDFSSSPPLAAALLPNRANLYQNESDSKKTFEYNLKTFLLERALENEIVALCLYWYVKVENKDVKVISTSPSSNAGLNTITSSSNLTTPGLSSAQDSSKSNFQMFMDELLESLRTGDSYARSIYENILNQEKFLKSLNEIVKATGKEGGNRDKKVQKLRTLLSETSKVTIPSVSSTTVSPGANLDLVNFNMPIPLIIDPNVKAIGINVDKTTMFVSNLMPCKFVFRTFNPDLVTSSIDMPEYSVIYKIGDDLRQDQLVLQMIALMDKLLKQENLDLKLTPYKVIATGVKEGFLQFVDALPLSKIIGANSDFRTVREYLRRHNQSDADRYGISAEAMDNYVRSCAGYLVITYILGIGDRHYDNILITKNGKIVHIDFGYILGRDPKPFQPTIKWTKDMADGMGGRYGPDGKTENKEYEDFKKFCCNAFLHLRRHANVILNLFSLMVDANIPDIAIEPDKTVKKLIDRFKLDVSDEQALLLLMREIESNYDHIVGNITDIIHGINTRQ